MQTHGVSLLDSSVYAACDMKKETYANQSFDHNFEEMPAMTPWVIYS